LRTLIGLYYSQVMLWHRSFLRGDRQEELEGGRRMGREGDQVHLCGQGRSI